MPASPASGPPVVSRSSGRFALQGALASEANALSARLGLRNSNATLVSSGAMTPSARVVHRLMSGLPVRMYVVGGSAAAGAGGAGVNHTFDARLTTRLNAILEHAEQSVGRPLGRVIRSSVAQGGTTSFWAALMAGSLHGRLPHIIMWEYAINDHAVSLEAAGRSAHSSTVARETMSYMMDTWLRRSLSVRPPPLLLLAYLWDKLPATAFKPGNRALCHRMPVAGSAFAAQQPTLQLFSAAGAGLAAVNVAGFVTQRRPGGFCPLVADSYFHPSAEGHTLISELLAATLLPLLAQSDSSTGQMSRLPVHVQKLSSKLPSSPRLPRDGSAAADGISAYMNAETL